MRALVPLCMLLILLLGLVQLGLGQIGIEHHLGFWVSVGAVILFFMRFALPISIGSYFGAVDVLGFPWWAGVLIAAPGLLFVVPPVVTAIIGFFADWVGRTNR